MIFRNFSYNGTNLLINMEEVNYVNLVDTTKYNCVEVKQTYAAVFHFKSGEAVNLDLLCKEDYDTVISKLLESILYLEDPKGK